MLAMSMYASSTALALVLAGGAGCSSETVLALLVTNGSSTTPSSLRVTEYGAGRTGEQTVSLLGRRLPGTLVLRRLDASRPDFRVLVDGLDDKEQIVAQAAVRPRLVIGGRGDATAELRTGLLPDSDGDGVPDVIDDCSDSDDGLPACVPNVEGDLPDLGLGDVAVPPDNPPPADAGPRPTDLEPPPARDLAPPPPRDMAPLLCPPGTLFCETWEKGYAGPPWSSPQGTGIGSATTVVADGVQPHVGVMSSHTTVPGSLQGAQWRTAPIRSITSGLIALRMYVWFGATPTTGPFILTVGSGSGNTIDSGYSFGGALVGHAVNWNVTFANSTGSANHPSTIPVPAARWSCIEFTYDFASNLGVLYVDRQQAVSFTEAPSWLGGALQSEFSLVSVGTTGLTTAAMSIFVDDLAIGTRRFNDCF